MQSIRFRDLLWNPLDLTDAESLSEIATVEIDDDGDRHEVKLDQYGAAYCRSCDEDCEHELEARRTVEQHDLI